MFFPPRELSEPTVKCQMRDDCKRRKFYMSTYGQHLKKDHDQAVLYGDIFSIQVDIELLEKNRKDKVFLAQLLWSHGSYFALAFVFNNDKTRVYFTVVHIGVDKKNVFTYKLKLIAPKESTRICQGDVRPMSSVSDSIKVDSTLGLSLKKKNIQFYVIEMKLHFQLRLINPELVNFRALERTLGAPKNESFRRLANASCFSITDALLDQRGEVLQSKFCKSGMTEEEKKKEWRKEKYALFIAIHNAHMKVPNDSEKTKGPNCAV